MRFDGSPVESDVGMWFSRKYNSTDPHLYTFCMTSQKDWYLVPSGGELQVCYLPGDQSENENIRFVVHDKRWMLKSHNAPLPYPAMHHLVTEMCTIFLMCVSNLFSFHQPPLYNNSSSTTLVA